jgi:replicative DNA helicase
MIGEFETNPGGMPTAEIAEESILCCFMRYPQKYIPRAASEGIDADCFWKLRPIYDEIISFAADHPEHPEIDIELFIQNLELNGSLMRVGGPSAVASLVLHGPTHHHWSSYTNQLREAKARRIAIGASKSLLASLTSEDAQNAATEAMEAIKRAISAPSRSKSGEQSASEFIKQWKKDFESTELIPGMATGFAEIDEISGGMRAGELWIVCAKSTRGKSVMMIQIAAEAIQRGETVAIFSLEMMAGVVTGRLVSVMGSVEYGAITQPKTSNKIHRAGIKRGLDDITASKVWIDDTPNQTMGHIEDECQRIRDITGGLDLIVIDYMQIVKGEKQRGETREQEVARISMAGKQMAKKFGVPVLSASQLNGAGEVRESKSLEQDADTLLFIGDDGIKIGKMRNGKRDQVIQLYLHGDKQKFLTYQ